MLGLIQKRILALADHVFSKKITIVEEIYDH